MKKIINKMAGFSHTPTGKAMVTGLLVITGLIAGHWLSWMLWVVGIWG